MDIKNNSLYLFLYDSNNILKKCANLFNHGDTYFYRVIALQLRILLCDTAYRHNRVEDISLVQIIYPNAKFFPLYKNGLTDRLLPKILLSTWLNQELYSDPTITIRNLIRLVCDQDGGAHVDIKSRSRLNKFNDYPNVICKLGNYVSSEIDILNRMNSGFNA